MVNRLGLYVDDVYRVVEDGAKTRISSDRAFILFAYHVAKHFDELVVFGRAARADEDADYVLPSGIRLVALPSYSNLRRLLEVARASAGTAGAMWRGLSAVDTVWVFGPHPFGFLLIALAGIRGKRVVLGVRQDTVQYHEARLQGARWLPVRAAVRGADAFHRLLSRRLAVTVVGSQLAKPYGAERPTTLAMTVSLVPEDALVDAPLKRNLSGDVEILTIGRVEIEKNPLLVVDTLAELERRRPGRYRLTWVGRGKLEEQVRARAAKLGVADRLTLLGYVPFGPGLLDLYRRAGLFLHVSLTEGVPQVLVEALACGTPIVATAVGGVANALDEGRAGVLVQPGDVSALANAIESVVEDEHLRERIVRRGLEVVRPLTVEAESARVARFLGGAEGPSP
jgi:glycosyltransferase involved in cell wall biosynthesis